MSNELDNRFQWSQKIISNNVIKMLLLRLNNNNNEYPMFITHCVMGYFVLLLLPTWRMYDIFCFRNVNFEWKFFFFKFIFNQNYIESSSTELWFTFSIQFNGKSIRVTSFLTIRVVYVPHCDPRHTAHNYSD